MLLLTAILSSVGVSAYRTFKEALPNGALVRNCEGHIIGGVGHKTQCFHSDCPTKGGGVRNQFGEDFAKHSFKWTKELCEMDSDGDGKPNGLELGDPDCEWKPGSKPKFDTAITHPGEDCTAVVCEDQEMIRAKEARPSVGAKEEKPKPPGCPRYEHPTTKSFPMLFPGNHTVAPGTSYMKMAFTQPLGAVPMMMTKFSQAVDDKRVVHHMVLYKCDNDMSQKGFRWPAEGVMRCLEQMMIWAVGGQEFCTPEGIGFLIEPGQHFLLEIHYDNPHGHTDVSDHSGFTMHGVPRENAMELVVARTWTIGPMQRTLEIPPRKETHRITAPMDPFFPADATENIQVFAYMQHMHLLGSKQWLTAEKPNGETEEVLCDTNYNFDLQETRYFPIFYNITPGTKLTLECVWDSSSRENITYGGEATTQEMCYTFLYFIGYKGVSGSGSIGFWGVFNHTSSSVADKFCGCEEGWVPPSDGHGSRVRMLFSHGVVMVFAWGLLAPAGAAFPLAWRKVLPEHWFNFHQGLQLVSFASMLVGLYFAFSVTEKHFSAQVPHSIFGLVIFIFAALQMVGGLCRPNKPESGESSSTRSWWFMGHRIAAALLIFASVAQCIGGAVLFGEYWPSEEGGFTFQSTTGLIVLLSGGWLLSLTCLLIGKVKESSYTKLAEPVVAGASENELSRVS